MGDNSYEAYKRDFIRDQRANSNFRMGKVLIVMGVCFLLYLLYILPFHAGNVSEIRGDEMKAGGMYDRVQVYYVDKLQLLCAKTDVDSGEIYCIAEFKDCNQNDWMISFTPGRDEELAKRIEQGILLSGAHDGAINMTINGYLHMQSMEELPFGADSFYSVYGSQYASADGANRLNMNADYLCGRTDSYMLELLFRPGILFASLVAGLFGCIYGGILLVRNRSHKMEKS